MARPIKKGLSYYNIDTDRYLDMRIKRLKKKYSCLGICIYDYLLNEIYRVEGYFINYNEDIDFAISECFYIPEESVKEVILYCCEIGLFSKPIYSKHVILTSKSIQNRYLKICLAAKRKNIKINKTLQLITEETELIPEETKLTTKETGINSGESTQSKVKERKVNKKKGEDIDVKSKSNKKEKVEIPKKEPIESEKSKMDIAWEKWTDYKKIQFKFSYKHKDSENLAKKLLWKMSAKNEQKAIKIIEHTMANGWKGFVDPDEKKNMKNSKSEYIPPLKTVRKENFKPVDPETKRKGIELLKSLNLGGVKNQDNKIQKTEQTFKDFMKKMEEKSNETFDSEKTKNLREYYFNKRQTA